MAIDDWAIVAGIRLYPGLSNLEGPENDARMFYKWVSSSTGGAVPEDQIALFLSPPTFPDGTTATEAQPTADDIKLAFDDLWELAHHNLNEGNGFQVGRRLYIYLSGHGSAPRLNDAALLTANATPQLAGYHILGREYADRFLRANFFEEVMLFVDCCRESDPKTPPNLPAYPDVTGPNALDKTKAFYGFGAKWARLSRERPMPPDGKFHGVFSMALMTGLNGDACDPSDGRITNVSLGNYLYSNMKNFLSEKDLSDPVIAQDPDLQYDTDPKKLLVISTAPVPKFPVTINLPPATAGKTVEILDYRSQQVASLTATPPSLKVDLTRGLYVAKVSGVRTPFEVSGEEEAHVNF